MQVWNVLRAARWKCGTKKMPKSRHLGTIAQICRTISSQLRHISTIGKKTCEAAISPHMSSIYGELWPTNGWDPLASLERPSKCNGFRVLSALLVGVSQTLRHWTEGTTYIRQGGHHVGHSGLFLLTHSVVVYSDTHAADSNFRLIFEYKNLIFAALMQLIPVLFIG